MAARLSLALLLLASACGRANDASAADRLITSGAAPDSLQVAPGLAVNLFARVNGARVQSVGPDGALYVTQTSLDQVTRLVDTNGDGVADSQTVMLSNLDSPHGLAWRGDWLYIANAGRDSMMYVSIGSSCNLCVESDSDRATVMQHEIWVSTHERDNIPPDHEDLPPEEIDILQSGGDYGWPYCHSDRVPNPEFHDQASRFDDSAGAHDAGALGGARHHVPDEGDETPRVHA